MSPKCFALGQIVEVHAADLIDHLSHQLAGLHVIVGVFKHAAHHASAIGLWAGEWQFLELGKQLGIDKGQERVASDAFGISGPGAPLQVLGYRRAVVVLPHLQLLVLVIDDFQKEHPAQL